LNPRAAALVLLAAGQVWADIAPWSPPRRPDGGFVLPPPKPQCERDADCVVTTFFLCCPSCPVAPYVMLRKDLERQQKSCVDVKCAPWPDQEYCQPVVPASAYTAACDEQKQCVLRRPPLAKEVQCEFDGDCRVARALPPKTDACWKSRCRCCEGTAPLASDVKGIEALRVQKYTTLGEIQPVPLAKGQETSREFECVPAGYKGMKGSLPPPCCKPCPEPLPARAFCKAGRCGVVGLPPKTPTAKQ